VGLEDDVDGGSDDCLRTPHSWIYPQRLSDTTVIPVITPFSCSTTLS